MTLDVERDPVRVNKLLGERASIGPIPAEQLLPWVAIGGVSFFLFKMLLAVSFMTWLLIWFWLNTTWWLLTGRKTYRFIKNWAQPPGWDWTNGETLFFRAHEDAAMWQKFRNFLKRNKKIQRETQAGARKFAPFQDLCHLHSIAEVELGGHRFACLLLYDANQDRWSAEIPFKLQGLHPQLYRAEVEEATASLQQGMAELLDGERLRFHTDCRSSIQRRKADLRTLSRLTQMPATAVMLLDEEVRMRELTEKGARQVWSQTVWATWSSTHTHEQGTDAIGKAVLQLKQLIDRRIRKVAGTEEIHFQRFYLKLIRQIHDQGYVNWRNILETKARLNLEPMDAQELWEWLWYRFNQRKAPTLTQFIRVRSTDDGIRQRIPPSGQKDLVTLLLQGDRGRSSCPKHKQQHGYVYVNGLVGKVGVIEAPPELWRNTRQQLKWIWDRLAQTWIRDTECVVEVTPKATWSTQDELEKMNRQSHFEAERAALYGTGQDVSASLQRQQAEQALMKLYEGQRPLLVACTFIVWRESERACDEAIAQLCNAFGAAEAVVENDVCWRVWLETLPINAFPLLTRYNAFSERRLVLDTETVAGFLPLTCPRDIHQRGVEFLNEEGGKPLYVDLFSGTGRVLITGTTGSGKSVLGWRFIADALAQNIPVVGIDLSSGGDSTFQTAVQALGQHGAYVDILHEHLNLLEPPNLLNLEPADQLQRFKRWKDFVRQAIVAIAMGQIHDPQLLERVNSIVLRTLDVFFGDAEITERYNEAIDHGWRSAAWQKMPTLHDFLKFCSREQLDLKSYEDMDARAINQIVAQVGAKLVDPNIGDAIGRPSSVNPEPMITFYALSGLTNESNAYIMALSAQMAALRNALAHPRSLFVGDELSVLLGKRGFADLIGETFATGRKEGISAVILAQDLDAIVQCSASAQILTNLSTTITGRTTHGGCHAYMQALDYPAAVIKANATERFKGSRVDLFTRWLVEEQGRFWRTRYYANPLMLAALASGEAEQLARNRVLACYPPTTRGYLEGLKDFTHQYVQAMGGAMRFEDIQAAPAARRRVALGSPPDAATPVATRTP
jgi:hypothetical protein